MTKKSRAFSLIELSIVILIIGILIAGVTQSSRLLRMAKLTTAQTLTKSSPVAGISGLVLWLEPVLDGAFASSTSPYSFRYLFFQDAFAASFPSSASIDDGDKVIQWNDINPQNSSKYYANYIDSGSTDYYAGYSEKNGPNGLPSVHFESNGSPVFYLSTSNISDVNNISYFPSDSVTFFAVYMIENSDSQMMIYNDDDTSKFIWYYQAGTSYRQICDVDCTFDGGTPPTAGVSEILSTTIDKTADANVYINGLNHINNQPLTRGSAPGGFTNLFFFSGTGFYLSEFIVFDRALKTEERQSIEAYLGKKYGIKVSSGTAGSI